MRYALGLAVLLLSGACTSVRAEHASIDLRVSHREAATGIMKDLANSHADGEPPAAGVNPRPLATVKAKEPLVLQFIYTNTYPHGTIKGARVRYFVVRVDKANQKNVPELTKDVVIQGTFDLNFKPQARVGARVEFTIPTPGIYLLRVQSENTNSDHEHFSAIDLQAE
jgi:hypothetical protein